MELRIFLPIIALQCHAQKLNYLNCCCSPMKLLQQIDKLVSPIPNMWFLISPNCQVTWH